MVALIICAVFLLVFVNVVCLKAHKESHNMALDRLSAQKSALENLLNTSERSDLQHVAELAAERRHHDATKACSIRLYKRVEELEKAFADQKKNCNSPPDDKVDYQKYSTKTPIPTPVKIEDLYEKHGYVVSKNADGKYLVCFSDESYLFFSKQDVNKLLLYGKVILSADVNDFHCSNG